ncbi:MAG: DUF899 family protein [Planctomycetota bacterium]
MTTLDIQSAYEAVLKAKANLLEVVRSRGPEPVEDWELRSTDGNPIKLSELFGEHTELLLVHNMGRRCSYCTLWADGLEGYQKQIAKRCAFALCSADEPDVAKAFAAERGWTYQVVSGAGSEFTKTMGYEMDDGSVLPGVSSFHKKNDGSIVRIAHTLFGPGDDFCPIWPLFDLLEGGTADYQPS